MARRRRRLARAASAVYRTRMSRGELPGGFTEREMRLIFERAGQASAESESDRRYSLAELRDIAAQAGLDVNEVARAAATIRGAPASKGLMGGPTRFRASRMLDRNLSEEEILNAVQALRAATALHGDVRSVPGGMEWQAQSATCRCIVDFARTSRGTRIDVLISRADHAVLTALAGGMTGLATGVIAGAIASVMDAGAASVAIGLVAGVGTAWASTRLMWSRIARQWSGETEHLSDIAAQPPSETG